jgi:hypothetical protein
MRTGQRSQRLIRVISRLFRRMTAPTSRSTKKLHETHRNEQEGPPLENSVRFQDIEVVQNEKQTYENDQDADERLRQLG